MKVKNQYLKMLEYLYLSFNKWHPYSINSGYLLFFESTIMGNTADLAMVQKTIIDTLHKESKSQRVITERGGLFKECCIKAYYMQSWLEGRNWVGKCAQATGMTASLRILSSKADSNTWESFTRSELKLESVHQESPRSDIFRKRATKPLLNQKHRQKHLTWAKEKNNWTLAQWSKVLFSDESKCCISFVNQGLRVWRKRGETQNPCSWSPVWSFHSQWWFGLPCHLLVLVHCVFWSPQSTQTSTRTFYSTSCFLLLTSFMEMLISFSSRTWHLPTLPKVPKAGSVTMCYCAWLASKLAWPEPQRI